MEVNISKSCQGKTSTTKSSSLAGMILFMRDFQIFLLIILRGKLRDGDKLWMNWNKVPLRLCQTQLNFAMCCALSACGVSSEHLNYEKHPMPLGHYIDLAFIIM